MQATVDVTKPFVSVKAAVIGGVLNRLVALADMRRAVVVSINWVAA